VNDDNGREGTRSDEAVRDRVNNERSGSEGETGVS
jgi:hypothetical protein